ncbi:hypothetical protein, partial [Dulcicalothrix desertica]
MYRKTPYTVSPYSNNNFSTTVEIIKNGYPPMNFQEYKKEFNNALDDEIKTLKKEGGQQIYVNDGIYLGVRGRQYVYSFSADRDILLPDDTPCILIPHIPHFRMSHKILHKYVLALVNKHTNN